MTAKSVFSFVQIAKFLVATTTIALTFVACGDDSGNSNAANNENIGNSFDEVREVATTRELGRCTNEREGDTVYVVEKMRDYICINHAWIDASENLGTTPSGGENTPSSSSVNNTPAATTSSSSSAQDTPATITSSSSSAQDTPATITSSSSSAQDTPATITSSSSSKTESSSSITENSSSSEAEPPSTHRDVEDVYSVGECSINIEGHTVFVKSNLVTYICEDGVWSVYIAPNTQTSSSSAISSTVPAYFEIADIMQLGKCTKESANAVALVKKDTSYYTCVNGNWIQSEEHGYVIKKRSILGVAQKGPFKFGAPVYLRELAGDDLHYTGKVYEDEISSNKGDFVIPNVNMIYPYASVEVKGQYRNEMTGAYSSAPISLFALTDLQTDNRTKVNVNLLTHLEYGRAMYLVRKGYSVYAAKRQADQEIMTAFELPTTVKYSEDLSVFEDSEDDNVDYANASLMVLDLLFLGERRDDEVVALIDGFAKDFEKDGVWDDDSTKAVMADFATEVDGDEVRANVKAWNILDIPDFESQLEMFWNNVYGLGGCTSVRSGVIANNKNKFSKNFDVYYKCSAGSWIKATQLEYDTYGWEAGSTGEVKKGNVTDAKYVYRNDKWNQASVEEGGLGSCLAKNEGTILTYESDYYVCKSSNWTKLTVAQADTYGWAAGEVGEVKKGTYTDAKYVYRNSKWNAANELETLLGSCVAKNTNTVMLKNDTYYACENTQWRELSAFEADTYGWTAGEVGEVKKGTYTDAKYVYRNSKWNAANELETSLGSCVAGNAGTVSLSGGIYYICKASEWIEASVFEYDTYGWAAGETGEVKKGDVTDAKYVYRNSKWNAANELETLLGSCVAKNTGTVSLSGDKYYICKANEWIEASVFEYDTYGWTAGETGEVKKGDVTDAMYVYRGGKWVTASELEALLGSCVTKNSGTVSLSGGIYYICKANEWIEASVFEYDTYGWTAGETGEVKKGDVTDAKYVYRGGKWVTASELEALLGSCVTKNSGTVSLSSGIYYICKANEWTKASVLEYDSYGSDCSKDGALIDGLINISNKYVCDAEEFRIATEDEVALNLGCTSYNKNQTILFEDEWGVVTWICSGKWTEKERSYKYGTLKDSRDNKTYKTVKIGNQIWMAENLNYNPGDVSSMGSYAWSGCYGDVSANCDKYGRLYTWEVAMNKASCAYGKTCGASLNPTTPVRGVCPQGWHLPSHYEFEELINYIDPSFGYDHTTNASSSTAGKYLKSKSGWGYYSASTVGTDAYGFSALPGGYRGNDGSFRSAGNYVTFWSSGEYSSNRAFSLYLLYYNDYAYLGWDYESDAGSIRCLQD